MFRFAVAAGCAAVFSEARRTGMVDMGDLDAVTQTAPPGQCRRRRCPGAAQPPTIPPPTSAPGEPIQCDRATPPTSLPSALMAGHQNMHYVGQGANACVYLSDEPAEAIKVSKWPSRPDLWSPRAECEKGQRLHAASCGDDELIAETETFLPTCTGGHLAQGPGDDSYIRMHRAGGLHPTTILRLGEGASHKLPVEYQKVVFAELISAIRLIHKLGFTHNDLHDGNVMLDLPEFLESFPWDRRGTTPEPDLTVTDGTAVPRLAVIDFGEMVPYAQGWVKDYKRDFNSVWDRTAFLANCPDHQARWWSTRGSQAGAEAFVNCLIDQWGVDNAFVETLWVAIHAAMEESPDQHMEDLFNTHFVQTHIPARDRRYLVGDSCNDPASLLQTLSTEAELASTAPAGYEELPGKCSGSWIENWADGHYAHYGEDHQIDSVDDCADTCDEHPECAAFYTKDGKCSHWRTGSISVAPRSGHTCYLKSTAPPPAPAPRRSHSNGACEAVDGYSVQAGKCSGSWIELWSDGNFAHYGEDHQISGVTDCADMCDEHNDCAGFYTKDGRCSHWRSGSLTVSENAGHCCYQK